MSRSLPRRGLTVASARIGPYYTHLIAASRRTRWPYEMCLSAADGWYTSWSPHGRRQRLLLALLLLLHVALRVARVRGYPRLINKVHARPGSPLPPPLILFDP